SGTTPETSVLRRQPKVEHDILCRVLEGNSVGAGPDTFHPCQRSQKSVFSLHQFRRSGHLCRSESTAHLDSAVRESFERAKVRIDRRAARDTAITGQGQRDRSAGGQCYFRCPICRRRIDFAEPPSKSTISTGFASSPKCVGYSARSYGLTVFQSLFNGFEA